MLVIEAKARSVLVFSLRAQPLRQAIPSFIARRIELLETDTKKLEEKARSSKLYQKCIRPNQSEKLELRKEARKEDRGRQAAIDSQPNLPC